jgi:hypothetical protein
LEGTSPDSRFIIVCDEACWFLERLSGIKAFTSVIIVITVPDQEVFGFALDLRISML